MSDEHASATEVAALSERVEQLTGAVANLATEVKQLNMQWAQARGAVAFFKWLSVTLIGLVAAAAAWKSKLLGGP
ncbi:MAG: hypothetical protein ACXWCO_00750 [Caldimonas sp.]